MQLSACPLPQQKIALGKPQTESKWLLPDRLFRMIHSLRPHPHPFRFARSLQPALSGYFFALNKTQKYSFPFIPFL